MSTVRIVFSVSTSLVNERHAGDAEVASLTSSPFDGRSRMGLVVEAFVMPDAE